MKTSSSKICFKFDPFATSFTKNIANNSSKSHTKLAAAKLSQNNPSAISFHKEQQKKAQKANTCRKLTKRTHRHQVKKLLLEYTRGH